MARAHGRVLDGDIGLADALDGGFAHLGTMRADDDDDSVATGAFGGIDGAVQHRTATNRMQDLGQGRLHPRPLAGGQDDSSAFLAHDKLSGQRLLRLRFGAI